MLVYLRIDVYDNLRSYTAFYGIVDSPAYLWRYTNYAEGKNYFRTYAHRSHIQVGHGGLSLGIL